ncbi:MAG: DUF4870 domain-containing protein [Fimbriimonadaceae bacterium]|nr:DUF4870 domain-containing protein [Fimbriimonadaceae bacterium]
MDPTSEEKQLAMVSHIGPLAVSLLTGGSLGWIVPLVLYLTKKDTSKFIGFHALQSLAFQVILAISAVVLGFAGFLTCGITWLLLGVIAIAALVFQIIAAIRANEGQWYMLPVAGDFAKKTLGP